jgi:hypothetical protein
MLIDSSSAKVLDAMLTQASNGFYYVSEGKNSTAYRYMLASCESLDFLWAYSFQIQFANQT